MKTHIIKCLTIVCLFVASVPAKAETRQECLDRVYDEFGECLVAAGAGAAAAGCIAGGAGGAAAGGIGAVPGCLIGAGAGVIGAAITCTTKWLFDRADCPEE